MMNPVYVSFAALFTAQTLTSEYMLFLSEITLNRTLAYFVLCTVQYLELSYHSWRFSC